MRFAIGLCATLLLAGGSAVPSAALRGVPVVPPGVADDAGAALGNPAAPAMLPRSAFFAAWEEGAGPWSALATNRIFTLGICRADLPRCDEVHLGLALGDRARALGLAYAWTREPDGSAARGDELRIGTLLRRRHVSAGATATIDLERAEHAWQADLGLRPMGPRITLFADAIYRRAEEAWSGGAGVELIPVHGLRIAGRFDDEGHYAVRVVLAPAGRLRFGADTPFDDQDHRGRRRFSLEAGPWRPPLAGGRLADLATGAGIRPPVYARVALGGALPYQRYLLRDRGPTLLAMLRHLDALAVDPRVAGVVLDLSRGYPGAVVAWEVRAQLAGLRARGKKVIVYADRLGTWGAMLASVADQIWLDPQGTVDMAGFIIGRSYYADALAKIGVGFDELRFFTYKSAAEIGARTSMSAAEREQRAALLDDAHAVAAELVTTARGLEPEAFDRLLDGGRDLRPAEAQAVGLIDSIGTCEEAYQAARRAPIRSTGDPAASALGGVMGDRSRAALEWGEPDRIEVLYATGECAMESGIRGPELARRVRAAREDGRVKALVLRVDSPGGDRLPSELVARELRETARVKPVIVSQGQVAASGGYWLSMEADTIVTTPLTRTGSIGVIAAHVWDDGLGEKLGLSYDRVQRGAHADYLSGWALPVPGGVLPHRPLSPAERDRAEFLIREQYGEFTARVALARGRSPAEIEAIAQGRVWSGRRALELGLVDLSGSLWDAVRLAKERAGLSADHAIALTRPVLGWIRRPAPLLAGRLPFGDGAPAAEAEAAIELLVRRPARPLLLAPSWEVVEGR